MSRLTFKTQDPVKIRNKSNIFTRKSSVLRQQKTQSLSQADLQETITQSESHLHQWYTRKYINIENPFGDSTVFPTGIFSLKYSKSHQLNSNKSQIPLPSTGNYQKIVQDLQEMVPRSTNARKYTQVTLKNTIKKVISSKLTSGSISNVSNLMQRPFDRPNSRQFFKYIKSGNFEQSSEMLSSDRYLVHVFDNTQMTALHWATLRGFLNIVSLLLSNSAHINAVDISHRTALHIASKNGFLDIIEELLKYSPNHLILTAKKQTVLSLAKDEQTRNIIKRYLKEKYVLAFG